MRGFRFICLAILLSITAIGCGDDTTTDPGVCDDNPCLNAGTCSVGDDGAAVCACPAGFTGPDCGLPVGTDICDPSPCLNSGTCADNGDNTYACTCAEGFEGTNCETAVEPELCDPNPCLNGGTCSLDDEGSATCQCPNGFTGDQCETAIGEDPCKPNPCFNGGVCLAGDDETYTCDCPEGYGGEHCDTAVIEDACNPNPCQNGGTCTNNGDDTYTCDCPENFDGENCENSLLPDPCDPNPCQNEGICVGADDGTFTFTCSCLEDYVGELCEQKISEICDPNPCLNGGVCNANVEDGTFTCECAENFSGDLCENKVTDPCDPNPCQNGGTCTGTPGDNYTCACPDGFEGINCENPIGPANSCVPNPCLNGGLCLEGPNETYSCACQDGFTGTNCENDVNNPDPCAPNPCQNGGLCATVDLPGAASCLIAQMVAGCAESKPCEDAVCGKDPFCCNTTWDSSCANCANGQLGFGGIDCTGVDAICAAGGETSYECTCMVGYLGKNCDQEVVDGCEPNPCQNGGLCTTLDELGDYSCDCPNGFVGANCETEISLDGYIYIGSYMVSDGAAWGSDPPTYSCVEACAAVFGGVANEYACSTTQDGVDHQGWTTSWGVGGCAAYDENYKKNATYNCGQTDCATSAYAADNCIGEPGTNYCFTFNPIGTCDPDPCENGGLCTENDDGTYKCECLLLFTGVNCETALDDPCDPDPCQNGGTCNTVDASTFICECPEGYVGDQCQFPPPCEPNPCQNGGTCTPDNNGNYLCACPGAFAGKNCEIAPPDPCLPNPCQNGGTCISAEDGTYTCECPANTTGNNCEFFDTGDDFEEVFSFTGVVQLFVVPNGVSTVTIQSKGAQGGGSDSCVGDNQPQDDGGLGGYSRGDLSVTPGQTLYVYVGGKGGKGTDEQDESGWNGGGDGGKWGGAGGGASDVRTEESVLNARVIVAGGGGGGNTGCPEHGAGGNGGGLTGQNGDNAGANYIAGGGGSQDAGGTAGTNGAAGELGQGASPPVSTYHFGGGGGGWYGGGSAYAAGGGGGSSFIEGVQNGITDPGTNPGHGSIVVSWNVEVPCVSDDECKDDNVCTTNTCDPNTGMCKAEAVPECCNVEKDCNDKDICTTDTCQDNVCVNAAIDNCCTDAAQCDDQKECTEDTCSDNQCLHDVIEGCCTDGAVTLGGDSCLVIPNVLTKEMTDYTIEFWLRMDSYEGEDTVTILDGIQPPGTALPGLALDVALSGPWAKKLQYKETAQGGGAQGTYLLEDFAEGAWHHLAITRKKLPAGGASICYYVDGKQIKCGQFFLYYPTPYNTDPLRIGCSNTVDGENVNYAKLSMDELRISKVVRYENDFEPAVVFNNDDNTLGLYHFDNAKGDDSAPDFSGNENHGSWDGAAAWSEAPPVMQVCEE